ncbi:MAG TPA: homoserine dehydrogenase [Thermoanaerobaculia bacterium]|nr:homoserine dehydrogenase [Thermoanaerobaculia bacterium]
MRRVRVGLLGCGTVGGGFVRLVEHERDRIRERFGVDLDITRILVRDPQKARAGVPRNVLTANALEVIDGDCDVIVEVIGGVHSAGAFVRRALTRGLDVVTANKALLAIAGGELFAEATRTGAEIGFEASVCGAVPVIGVLQRALSGDSVQSITGILNGTSNYVLCRMEEGYGFAQAVALAQERGFAEADPSMDLRGDDAEQKLSILAQLAFEVPVRHRSVTGIDSITPATIANARRDGCVIRQIADVRRTASGVMLVVEPRRLPIAHRLARVEDEQNAVVIRSRAAGELFLSGRGAGSMPTATAVLSDVLAIANHLGRGAKSPPLQIAYTI